MLIWEHGDFRVYQHSYLTLFYVHKWSLGDSSRNYGQCWDWHLMKECLSIQEVKDYLKGIM